MPLDLRPSMVPILDAFGVPATVTRPAPDDVALPATLVWVSPEAAGVPIGDAPLTRTDPKRYAALTYAEVPTVPRGTVVSAAETLGAAVREWRVDGTTRVEFDHVIVVLLPLDC